MAANLLFEEKSLENFTIKELLQFVNAEANDMKYYVGLDTNASIIKLESKVDQDTHLEALEKANKKRPFMVLLAHYHTVRSTTKPYDQL